MAESELKLDIPCPWCGTPNTPASARCRHCFQDLEERVDEKPEELPEERPALFDMTRPTPPCPSCGNVNMLSTDECLECGASMKGGRPAPAPEPAVEKRSLKAAARTRRRPAFSLPALNWSTAIFLVRLGSVLYLFWGVLDTSTWLNNVTSGLKPDSFAAVRYNIFAVFELVRNICLVLGIWLLTFLRSGLLSNR